MWVNKLRIGRIVQCAADSIPSRRAAFAATVALLAALGAQATTYWLGTGANASDSNDGTSKDAPFATWEYAFAAVGAANNNTLNVLPGTYTLSATPTEWTRSGVTIRGVYANGDPITNTTDAASVVIDGDNSYRIFPLGKNPTYLTLCGITFQNGSGQPVIGYENTNYDGCNYNSISNCVFQDCSNGATLCIAGQGNRLEDCVFRRNTAVGSGLWLIPYAVLHLLGPTKNSTATNYVRRCLFEGNGAENLHSTACIVGRMTAVEDCIFRANTGTGNSAIRSSYNNPHYAVIRNCTFESNTNTLAKSTSAGSGIVSICDSGDGCIIEKCRFLGNNAGYCNGLFVTCTNVVIAGCTFDGNAALENGQHGGVSGVWFQARGCNALVTNCTFRANESRVFAANDIATRIEIADSVLQSNKCEQLFYNRQVTDVSKGQYTTNVFRRCTFADNGMLGVYTRYGMLQLGVSSFDSCVFTNNTSVGNIISSYGSISMTNCLFAGNSTTGKAVDGGDARGVDMFDTAVNSIVNCTFADNSTGHAVVYREKAGDEIVNCIFANNTWTDNSSKLLQYSGTSNCFADFVPYGTWANLVGGTAGADPGFKDAANGDYTLKRSSVCRNAGINADWMADAIDLSGNARINAEDGNVVDIGCYEFFASTPGLMIFIR